MEWYRANYSADDPIAGQVFDELCETYAPKLRTVALNVWFSQWNPKPGRISFFLCFDPGAPAYVGSYLATYNFHEVTQPNGKQLSLQWVKV
jgi:hypothetical protein